MYNISKIPLQSKLMQSARRNHTSATAMQIVNVISVTLHNEYVYSQLQLRLAYGIAIALAAVAFAIGLFSIFMKQASYSDNFSTFFCTAAGAQASAELFIRDTDGRDPLPEYITKATVTFMREGRRANDGPTSTRRTDGTSKGDSPVGTALLQQHDDDLHHQNPTE